MGYFPFYMDISGKKCVIVGGGKVALRKTEKLLSFSPDITVVAPKICAELEKLPLAFIRREFRDADLSGAFMAIAATEDNALNTRISMLCRERNININSVDDIENCSFIFPALVHKDDITVGISTGGTSPVFAKFLRMSIEKQLDDRTIEAARLLKNCRPLVMEKFSTENERHTVMETLLERCLSGGSLPEEKDIAKFLEETPK